MPEDALSDALVRELYELRNIVDDLIEQGLVRRSSVSDVLAAVLPRIAAHVGVEGIFVETYSEDLELHCFAWPADGGASDPRGVASEPALRAQTSEERRGRICSVVGDALVVAQHLDVAGAWFGRAGMIGAKADDPRRLAHSLNGMCEVLDNYLFAIRAAREKHAVMMKLGNALRHRVLAEGLKDAVKVLSDAIPIERLALVYMAEDSAARATTLHVQMFEGAELRVDTLATQGESLAPLRAMGRQYLAGESTDLLDHLGVKDAQEEVLINGITKSVIVGKIVVTAKSGTFNTYDRELLSAFAGYIRQRVVDFNKEWRSLAFSFRPDDVARLLQTDDYEQRFLAPREETVAIVYVDIAGFTKLSETVLKTPANVASLVETWSRDAVEIVWHHGGVFDKMVGDCIIALFGPPFYDDTPSARLARALRCAEDIRDMTNKVPERVGLEMLREPGLAVSTGVNLAPLFVGQFGPNSNFTGFSSGMNNTARLQGCAAKNEVLVMQSAIEALGPHHAFRFGPARTMAVKNVAEPLAFCALAPQGAVR